MPQIVEFIASGASYSERKLAPVASERGRARKGVLHVLVDVDYNDDGALAQQIRQSIETTFYRDTGSVTSSLLRAIRRVNESLYDENERSIRSQRRYATVVAAVVRDSDIYFAIIGVGQAYLIDDGPTERVGATDEADQIQRLGESDEIGIAMYHRGRERASLLLLATGHLLALLDDAIKQVPNIPPERAIPLLRLLGERGGKPFHALAVVPHGLEDDDVSRERLHGTAARASRARIVAPQAPEEDLEEEDDDDVPARWFPSLHVPLPAYFALGICVLFVVGYLIARVPLGLLQNGAAYANTVTRLAQAEQEEQAALQQTDPTAKRQHLDNARRLAQEAQAMGTDKPAVATAVARIDGEYQAATGTIALPAPVTLIQLSSPADQMLVQGLEIYVLHRQTSQVDRYLLNADQSAVLSDANTTLVRKGDHIGSATVGDLTAMAWMPAGGARDSDSLVVLDRSGYLIQYDSTRGLRTLALRDPTNWGHVTAIGGYAGNLFALDPTSQTIAWYPPEPSGYDGDAYSYFAPTTKVDLSDAVAFLAGNDLYLVHLSGKIEKFTAGKPDNFAGPPSDLMPTHPAGLAMSNNSLYIGDPERAHIVQVGTDGGYRRTLGGTSSEAVLSKMRDLAVSDDGKTLYVLTDTAIDRFDLTQAH